LSTSTRWPRGPFLACACRRRYSVERKKLAMGFTMDFAREPRPRQYTQHVRVHVEKKLDYNMNHLLATGTKCVARFPNPPRAHRIRCVGSVVNSAVQPWRCAPSPLPCSHGAVVIMFGITCPLHHHGRILQIEDHING
jgi:hypothetical protein